MPYGPVVALHALAKGVKKVGILTSGNHHADPFVFAFDALPGFSAGDTKVVCSNNMQGQLQAGGAWVKNWARLLAEVTA
jgi:hypothetical protein